MSAHDWSPYVAADFLRQAREAATPTDDLALIEATIQAGLSGTSKPCAVNAHLASRRRLSTSDNGGQ